LLGIAHAAQTDNVVVGVNTVGIGRMNEQQQDAFVEQLRENGVKVLRLGMDEKYAHFIIRTSAKPCWLNRVGIRQPGSVLPHSR
jgi:hypothetical protein